MPLVLAVALSAQTPTVRTIAPLVLVPVTVVDRKDRPIDGLTARDFVVTDDGVRQKIDMDTTDILQAPLTVVVLVQSSGVSEPALERIRQVGGMIQPLIAGDRGRAAVITFASEVQLVQEFTSDSAKLRAAFAKIQTGAIQQGRLIDAVAEGVRLLNARPENSRRVLLMLSESRDRGSKTKLAQVVEAAQRSSVIIYPATYSAQKSAWVAKPQDSSTVPRDGNWIGLITEPARLAKTNDAEVLARATGGRHLSFLTLKSLEDAIARASEEIHSQYLLSFPPAESANAGYHRILVTVPSRKDVVIRARPGYWPR